VSKLENLPAEIRQELDRRVPRYSTEEEEAPLWSRFLPIRKLNQAEWEDYQLRRKQAFRERYEYRIFITGIAPATCSDNIVPIPKPSRAQSPLSCYA
jgi:hypothetical protein